MPSPLLIRYIGAALLFVVGAIVLGISVHVEHAGRTIGFKSHTFTYDAFVGAWTILVEVVLAACRHFFPTTVMATFAVELGALFLSLVFWLASGIDTTIFTSEGRSVCKHLDDLFDLPEFEQVDQDVLQQAKNVLSDACSELHAELAFIWIGFVATTLLFGYLIVQALRMRSRGVPKVMQKTLGHSAHVAAATPDPFADPVGSSPQIGAGIAGAR